VSTWIALVFDLLDKMRELAVAGNGTAKHVYEEFETLQGHIARGDTAAIDRALKFERNILETARDKLELLDQQQYLDLERLREDRNRCAHPTFQKIEVLYSPTAELARTHLHNAVVHVLGQMPVQGKAALTELKALVESRYFPIEFEKARTQLGESALGRPSDALVRNFVDYLLFSSVESGHALKFDRRALAAMQASLALHRNIVEDRAAWQLNRLAKSLRDEDMIMLVVFGCALDGIWPKLEASTRQKVDEFATRAPIDQFARGLRYLLMRDNLRASLAARVSQLDVASLALIIEKNTDATVRELIVDRAVEEFSGVGSWNSANYVADKLILPLVPLMKERHVETVVRAPKERGADLPGSGGFSRFLQSIVETKIVTQDRLDELLIQHGLEHYAAAKPGKGIDDDIPF
jgi:hypothetical protein